MKLKYYLRGLGIGVIVTALLMGIALSGRKETLTDDEIRQRALELGMSDDTAVLSDALLPEGEAAANNQEDIEAEPEEAKQEVSEPEVPEPETVQPEPEAAGEEPDESETAGKEEPDESEEAEAEKNKPKDADETSSEAQPDETGTITAGESITITVDSGDGSKTVANKLQEAGVIADATAFDLYLCQNGYDKRIAAGTHEIKAGATEAEIAEALTR